MLSQRADEKTITAVGATRSPHGTMSQVKMNLLFKTIYIK